MAPHRLWGHLGTYMAASWHPGALPWRTVGPLSTLMAYFVKFSVAPWCPFSTLIESQHIWSFLWHSHGIPVCLRALPWHPCGLSVRPSGMYMAPYRSSMVPFWYPVRSLSTRSAATWHLHVVLSQRPLRIPKVYPVAPVASRGTHGIPVHSPGGLAALCGHAKCILYMCLRLPPICLKRNLWGSR